MGKKWNKVKEWYNRHKTGTDVAVGTAVAGAVTYGVCTAIETANGNMPEAAAAGSFLADHAKGLITLLGAGAGAVVGYVKNSVAKDKDEFEAYKEEKKVERRQDWSHYRAQKLVEAGITKKDLPKEYERADGKIVNLQGDTPMYKSLRAYLKEVKRIRKDETGVDQDLASLLESDDDENREGLRKQMYSKVESRNKLEGEQDRFVYRVGSDESYEQAEHDVKRQLRGVERPLVKTALKKAKKKECKVPDAKTVKIQVVPEVDTEGIPAYEEEFDNGRKHIQSVGVTVTYGDKDGKIAKTKMSDGTIVPAVFALTKANLRDSPTEGLVYKEGILQTVKEAKKDENGFYKRVQDQIEENNSRTLREKLIGTYVEPVEEPDTQDEIQLLPPQPKARQEQDDAQEDLEDITEEQNGEPEQDNTMDEEPKTGYSAHEMADDAPVPPQLLNGGNGAQGLGQ